MAQGLDGQLHCVLSAGAKMNGQFNVVGKVRTKVLQAILNCCLWGWVVHIYESVTKLTISHQTRHAHPI